MAEEQLNEEPKFTVSLVDDKPLSKVEQEKKFLQEEEEKNRQLEEESKPPVTDEVVEDEPTELNIKDEDVLSFIKKTRNKELTSIDDLFKEPEVIRETEEIPFEDVKAFLDYKKKTGRGLEDFMKLNMDVDKMDQNQLLADYYKEVEDFDSEDVAAVMRKYAIDEDMDTEEEIAEKKLAFKREVKKAVKHFEGLKEQFKVPLESRDTFVPEEEREAYKSFKTRTETERQQLEDAAQRSKVFAEKTDALLNEKFEGFDFKLDDNTSIKFKPADPQTLKQQSNIQSFIGKFLDENGVLKGDGAEFHKAIAMASDPDKASKFFYEQGYAAALEKLEKESKNIDMHQAPASPGIEGLQIKALDSNSSSTFKYRKR